MTVVVSNGDLVVAKAIDAVGTAAATASQTGRVSLTASGNISVIDTVTGRGSPSAAGVFMSAGSILSVNADLTAVAPADSTTTAGTTLVGNQSIRLGADLSTDSGAVFLNSSNGVASFLTATTVTIDTDQSAGGLVNGVMTAGNVTVGSGGIYGDGVGPRTLIIDARETSGGTGGSISLGGAGGQGRIDGLGIGGSAALLNTSASANSVGRLAVELSGVNQAFTFNTTGTLTIGTVGPFSGITTNTGNVSVGVSNGDLVVDKAINAVGAAAATGSQAGRVSLTASSSITVNDTVTGRGFPGNSGVFISAGGVLSVNADLIAVAPADSTTTAGISLIANQSIRLGADLSSDSGAVFLNSSNGVASFLTATTVTIDTDQTDGGIVNGVTIAGNVIVGGGGIHGDGLAPRTLVIDARETSGGVGGNVSLGGAGGQGRVEALGIGGNSLGFSNNAANNSVGTLALEVSGANQGVSFATTGSLTIGTVGPFTGITTNTANVSINVTNGDLVVNEAIDPLGAAAASGSQSGRVSLTASGNITINDTVKGRGSQSFAGVGMSAGSILSVNADVTTVAPADSNTIPGISLAGSGAIRLGADLSTDSGLVLLNTSNGSATFLTASTVTIDTDQTAGGLVNGVTAAGSVSVGSGGIHGDGLAPRALIIDARETSGLTGGQAFFSGGVGGQGRIDELGISSGSLVFNTTASLNSVGKLAVELSGANQGFGLNTTGSLTIGTVGAFSGITTRAGNVSVNVTSGNLVIDAAIDAVGTAATSGPSVGRVGLSADGNITINDTVTGRAFGGTIGVSVQAGGILSVNAGLTVVAPVDTGTVLGINLGGTGGIRLGADLSTDSGLIQLNPQSGATILLTRSTVTIDTDQTAGGIVNGTTTAGAVTIGSGGIHSDGLGSRTLIVDARETSDATAGAVSFSGGVGGQGRIDALGIAAGSLTFNNSAGANNVGTLAVALSTANRNVTFVNSGPLTVGTVSPFSGITTNSGDVSIQTTNGDLTIAAAISAAGAAPTGSTGAGIRAARSRSRRAAES